MGTLRETTNEEEGESIRSREKKNKTRGEVGKQNIKG